MRQRQCITVAAIVFFVFCTYSVLRLSNDDTKLVTGSSRARKANSPPEKQVPVMWEDAPDVGTGPKPKPRQVPGTGSHPIWYLLNDAQRELDGIKSRQSQTLEAAVKEYRRRYGMPPPPRFDKWFAFAKGNDVQLIDEFDAIYDLITPFWGLKPKTIRARAKEALGYDNGLLGVAIRNHEVSHMAGGTEWQRNATEGMMAKFIQHLPDMDLAFNVHDEPRVMVPHDDLTRLVNKAWNENMPASNATKKPANDFTRRVPELSDRESFEETKLSRFNDFSHQATWTHSRMSCPPDSPARILEDDERADDLSGYGVGELGFVYNMTAMSDICLTPSLSYTYGFFDRPNAYKIVHDLFPIFSQSKISSYNDIIYPSPWYWYEKVAYQEDKDRPWTQKQDKLYWRGSTTGGFSRSGGWRRQHRQHFVQKINDRKQALIMVNNGGAENPKWEVKQVPRGDYREFIDVHFSHVGQCDHGDCEAQRQFFEVKERVEQQDAWKYKYLLDIDGNAFSGRFYAFLRSMSLTFKLAVFREWHNEWLRPWAHYVPLSVQGDEWLEAVRFFGDSSLGNNEAERIAMASRDWASKVVRKEDMEAWFFRLLLEYARVIDDHREIIGFDPLSASQRLEQDKA
ncbi:Beta-1,2-xylosyltransferase 1, partial [Tolypocladium paradoxum]